MRSTIHRLGKTTNPFCASDRRTISNLTRRRSRNCRTHSINSPAASAIGPDHSQPRPVVGQHFEQQPCAIPVLRAGCRYDDHQQQAEGVDQNVPFAPIDVFSSIIAMLRHLPEEWALSNEGPESVSKKLNDL